MNYSIVHKPKVFWDIDDAVVYYKAISPKLAKQFVFRFKQAVTHIERTPVGFQIKYREVRTLMLKQFPYKIHYFIDNDNKQIVILAVVNAYRKPMDYSNR